MAWLVAMFASTDERAVRPGQGRRAKCQRQTARLGAGSQCTNACATHSADNCDTRSRLGSRQGAAASWPHAGLGIHAFNDNNCMG